MAEYKVYVHVGNPAYALVTWRNGGKTPYAPIFRFDLRRSGTYVGMIVGEDLQALQAQPGETVQTLVYCKVPSTWGESSSVDWDLYVVGIELPVTSGKGGYAVFR